MKAHPKLCNVYCQYCGQGFYQNSSHSLTLHYHNRHPEHDLTRLPYPVIGCSKTCGRQAELTKHVEKSHPELCDTYCQYCGHREASIFLFDLSHYHLPSDDWDWYEDDKTLLGEELGGKLHTQVRDEKGIRNIMNLSRERIGIRFP